jgi:MYXO-CTERM domain-containing protein
VKWGLCALLFWALPAHAYKRSLNSSQVCIWWTAHGHSFQIDSLGTPDVPGTAALDAIRRSYQTWAAVSCSDLSFPEEPLSTASSDRLVGYFQTGANHNLVLFRTRACRIVVPANDACHANGGCSNLYDCWDQGDAVIASTTTTTDRRTGEIVDSDIELNNAPKSTGATFKFTAVDGLPCLSGSDTNCVAIDVQNTVTHEAGHTLGLDHPPDHPEAAMYASGPSGETSKRILAADDIQGICSIYPRGASSVTCTGPAPDSGGCGCSATQTGPGAALAALLLLLQIRRRSRSRPQLAIKSSTAPATAARFHSGSEN